jgi:hypothetical protein
MTTRIPAVLALAAALGLGAMRAAADDPKLPDTKTFDKLVIDSLRDVHNKGADLYNTSKDFTGAYRMYQGALTTVRPLLGHRPEAQKIIDAGLTAADKETDAARKAFLLHEAIEGVRKHLKTVIADRKPEDPKKPDDKKPDDKKPDDKKPLEPPKKPEEKKPDDKKTTEPPKKPEDKKPGDPKKSDEKKPEDKKPDGVALAPMPKNPMLKAGPPAATVSGNITLAGKPLAEGEVTVVSLNQPLPRVFTATVKNGDFKFAEAIPPGRYAAIVTGKGVPAKYHLVNTAGLMLELAAGANATNLVLK